MLVVESYLVFYIFTENEIVEIQRINANDLIKKLSGQVEYNIKGDTVVHLKVRISKS